ncbi:MAG: hypothetical protein LAP85_25260 [Acidobacteriia bacterium]|nr:hypothetical protein [Terriglobia bacterium]
MAVPTYLASSFRYKETGLITDVSDAIAAFRDEVLNQNDPAWTEPSSGLFQSPADASGRWIDVLLTRIAATNLECRVRNSSGVTIETGRIQIEAGGNIFRLFTGQFHFHIESLRLAQPEAARGGILDLSPEAQNIHTQWAYASNHRTTADGVQPVSNIFALSAIDNAAAARVTRICALLCYSEGSIGTKSPSGGFIFTAANLVVKSGGSNDYFLAGRMYQQMLCDSDLLAGSEIVVPIDAGTYGTFKVSGIPTANNIRLALRIA